MRKKKLYYIFGVGLFVVLYLVIGMMTSTKVRLQETTVETGFTVSIGQLTDTHIGTNFDPSKYQDTINQLQDQDPQIILFTGDLFQTDEISEQLEEDVTTWLQTLDAPYKLAVLGNHDYHTDGKVIIVKRILENAGFTILLNQAIDITISDQQIHIIGLDDLRLGNTDYETILDTTASYDHVVVLTHEPDTFAQIKQYDVDIVFAGHSHGGQIRFPFIGSLVNVPGAKIYDERYYEENNTKLYISFGLGESVIPIRIFNPRRIEIYYCS